MSALTPLQRSFDGLSPNLPEHIRYRVQRAIHAATKDPFYGNATEIFQYALSHLYRKHLALKTPRIVVCTGVAHDGLGDFMHAVHAFTTLKDSLSSPHATMICSVNDFQKRKSILSEQILKAANECIFAENFNEDKELLTEAQKALDTAEVIVKVATGSLMTGLRGLSINATKRVLNISELGLGVVFGLGFSPQDMGVPIPIEAQAAILDDSDLADLLAKNSNRPNYSFHLGYLKQYSSQNAFFSLCCLAAKTHDTSLDIVMPMKDICSTGWTDTEEDTDALGNKIVEFAWVLNQLKLKQISLYVRNKEGKLTCKQIRAFGETGLDVRIINPFPISLTSFALLSSRSELCTGCTGDFSFLGVALGNPPQIPFYEILGHKLKFYNAFIEFLQESLPETSSLLHFFQSLLLLRNNLPIKELFGIAQSLAQAIQTPETHAQMKHLSGFIKKYFNSNEALLDCVSREIAHVRHPKLQALEETLYDAFFKDRGSLNAAYTQLRTAIIQTAQKFE